MGTLSLDDYDSNNKKALLCPRCDGILVINRGDNLDSIRRICTVCKRGWNVWKD